MIHKRKQFAQIRKDWVVCDIENRSDGTVLAIDTYDGLNHVSHYGWREWYDYLRKIAPSDTRYRTIYAHNGCAWDWLSFLEWCIRENPSQSFYTIENGNRIICVVLPLSDRCTVRLTDSLYLLQTSLDVASEKYAGIGKIRLEHLPEWYWDNDRESFWRYLYRDTEILHKTMVAFSTLIHEQIAPIGRLGLTLPSTALHCFQTRYLSKPVSVPTCRDVRKLLRSGYVGGRVEVFKPGYYSRIYVYDVNSLYPSVMATTPVPNTGTARYTKRFDADSCGVWDISFKQLDTNKYPILMVGGVGAYSGRGIYYTNEVQRLLRLARGQIEVHTGLVFQSSSVLFCDYVETLYSLRLTDKDGSLGAVCKLLMNSLYGKFAIRPERQKTMRLDTDTVKRMVSEGKNVTPLSSEWGIFRVEESQEHTYEHVGISGTITSEARGRLWEMMDKNTVYVDTDSVHTTRNDMYVDSRKLGGLKLEFSGEGVYCGKKLYALRNSDTEKVRVKGVKVGGKMGHRLDFDSLVGILNGAVVQTTFKSGSTANMVLRGGKSCVFNERNRKLRKTAHEHS